MVSTSFWVVSQILYVAVFAAPRVRITEGPPQRIGDKGMQHMPGEEAWIVGERRSSGEHKYYLSNMPADSDLKTLAAAVKARWVCEPPCRRPALPRQRLPWRDP